MLFSVAGIEFISNFLGIYFALGFLQSNAGPLAGIKCWSTSVLIYHCFCSCSRYKLKQFKTKQKTPQYLFYCESHSTWNLITLLCGFVMWINSFIVLLWLVSVCSDFFFTPSWPWGEKTQKMYSFNLMPVWGVSPASSDQWKVNSLHFLFHSAVLIFLQLLLPFSLRLVSFNPWDWSDCHRLDKLTSAW